MLPSPPRPVPAVLRTACSPRVGWRSSAVLLCVLVAGGCGKRGAPLAPLPRVPAAVSGWTVLRSDDTVALSLVVPGANVSGDTPGDIAAVEVYAVTADRVPELVTGRLPAGMNLIASSRVRRPLPPLPASAPAEVPAVPREPGLDQGESTTFRERLTPELLVAADAMPGDDEAEASDAPRLSLPPVFAPATARLKRHYAASAVSRRGVRGAWSEIRSVPIGPVSGAPAAPVITYDAAAIALAWTPAADARSAPSPDHGDLLEARPLGPPVAATRYNVYAVGTAGPEGARPMPPGSTSSRWRTRPSRSLVSPSGRSAASAFAASTPSTASTSKAPPRRWRA